MSEVLELRAAPSYILVFEADVDALRAVFRTGQCLHRHGLRQRSSRIVLLDLPSVQ